MNNEPDTKPHPPAASRASRWVQLADRSRVVEFVDSCLRGCAQVIFQNNAFTGVLFFLAIAWGAHAEGYPDVAIGAVLATVVGTGSAYLFGLDRESLRSGLYGYSSTLIGVALPTFLSPTPTMWVCLVFGAVVCPLFTLTLARILKTWRVAALTAPFVFTTWFILLGVNSFSDIHGAKLPMPHLPHPLDASRMDSLTPVGFLSAGLYGIGQVFLLPNLISGALILVGLAVSSAWALAFAIFGSLLGLGAAQFLGAGPLLIHGGLYSFCSVLTAVALGDTFNRPGWRVLGYTVIGVLFTVIIQGALSAVLSPFGLPILTMPFVLASWLFLVSDQQPLPEHHQ